jgi:hypothetical protein
MWTKVSRLLAVWMATLAVFQAGTLAACAKLTAVVSAVLGYDVAPAKLAIAILVRTVFFGHDSFPPVFARGTYHASSAAPRLIRKLVQRERAPFAAVDSEY